MSARLRAIFITLTSAVSLAAVAAAWSSCATIPEPKYAKFPFPKNVFVGDTQRPYVTLGPVRSKVDFVSLDSQREEKDLCRNYYNKAVKDLLKYAKRQGADAVIDVKSVVFLEDGRRETYKTPECSDDGGEGQVLTQGIAVKWQGSGGPEMGSWTQPAPKPSATPVVVAKPSPIPESEWVAPLPSGPLPIEARAAAASADVAREPGAETAPLPVAEAPAPQATVKVKMQSVAEAEPASEAESQPEPPGRPQLETPPGSSQRFNLADPRGIPGTTR